MISFDYYNINFTNIYYYTSLIKTYHPNSCGKKKCELCCVTKLVN